MNKYSPLRDRKLLTAVLDAIISTITLAVGYLVAEPETAKAILAVVLTWQAPIGLLIIGFTVEDAQIIKTEGREGLAHFR